MGKQLLLYENDFGAISFGINTHQVKQLIKLYLESKTDLGFELSACV